MNDLILADLTLPIERPYEVLLVKKEKLRFIKSYCGHATKEEAQNAAYLLAKKYPGETFIVYGPMTVHESDIPVRSTDWKDTTVKGTV